MKGGASSVRPLDFNMLSFYDLLVIAWAVDINKNTSHSRAIDPDMALSSSPVQMSAWPQVAALATQTGIVPGAVWPLDTNMVLGG